MFFKAFICNVSRFYKQLLDIPHAFMGPLCLLCGSSDTQKSNLCSLCLKQLPIVPEHCLQCARSLPIKSSIIRCGACQSLPPPFERTFTLFPYIPPITKMITRFKFHHDLNFAHLFGVLMTDRILNQWYFQQDLPDLIVPVPLHPKRLAQRGFNQSLEIAKPIAKALHIPIDFQLKRNKYTTPQHKLSAAKRKLNVKHAFSSQSTYANKVIVVIDDVITTGYTIKACCQTLKENGAKTIHVWCCARRMTR